MNHFIPSLKSFLFFHNPDSAGRTCLYADSAGNTLGRLQVIITLYHNILRAEANAHQAAGTFLLIQAIYALGIRLDHSRIAYLRTFSALGADCNSMGSVLFIRNTDAGLCRIRHLVKGFGACFLTLAAANAE
jgi:hypothetical protein